MDTRFAITEYPDAAVLQQNLMRSSKKPIYSINRTALKSMKKNTLRRSVQSQRK